MALSLTPCLVMQVAELFPEWDNKPALVRAYKAADLSEEGWVQRGEFKSFLQHLVYFSNVWEKFEHVECDDDRRLPLQEVTIANPDLSLTSSSPILV